jgi:hypothetical protein
MIEIFTYLTKIVKHTSWHRGQSNEQVIDSLCTLCHPISEEETNERFKDFWNNWVVPIAKGTTYTSTTYASFLEIEENPTGFIGYFLDIILHSIKNQRSEPPAEFQVLREQLKEFWKPTQEITEDNIPDKMTNEKDNSNKNPKDNDNKDDFTDLKNVKIEEKKTDDEPQIMDLNSDPQNTGFNLNKPFGSWAELLKEYPFSEVPFPYSGNYNNSGNRRNYNGEHSGEIGGRGGFERNLKRKKRESYIYNSEDDKDDYSQLNIRETTTSPIYSCHKQQERRSIQRDLQENHQHRRSTPCEKSSRQTIQTLQELYESDNGNGNGEDTKGKEDKRVKKLLFHLAEEVHQFLNRPYDVKETRLTDFSEFKGSNQDPIEWLRAFENACRANCVTEERKLAIVPSYLKGVALTWFDCQPVHYWDNHARLDE